MNSLEQTLERRLRQAERSFLIYKICLATLSAFVLLLIWTNGLTNRFGVVQAQSDKLRLRELDILDDKGRERIVIAAPLPDPVINGKTGHRIRVVSAAIQLKTADGNEQGGIALSTTGLSCLASMTKLAVKERTSTTFQNAALAFTSREKTIRRPSLC